MFKKYMCLVLCLLMALGAMTTTASAANVVVDGLTATHVTFMNEANMQITEMPANASVVTANVKVSNTTATAAPVILWVGKYESDVLTDVAIVKQEIAAGATNVPVSVSMANVVRNQRRETANGPVIDLTTLKAYVWTGMVGGKALAAPASFPSSSTDVAYVTLDNVVWGEFDPAVTNHTIAVGTNENVPVLGVVAKDNSAQVVVPALVKGANQVTVIGADGVSTNLKNYNFNLRFPLEATINGEPWEDFDDSVTTHVIELGDDEDVPSLNFTINPLANATINQPTDYIEGENIVTVTENGAATNHSIIIKKGLIAKKNGVIWDEFDTNVYEYSVVLGADDEIPTFEFEATGDAVVTQPSTWVEGYNDVEVARNGHVEVYRIGIEYPLVATFNGAPWVAFNADKTEYTVAIDRTKTKTVEFAFESVKEGSQVGIQAPAKYVDGKNVVKVIRANGYEKEYIINLDCTQPNITFLEQNAGAQYWNHKRFTNMSPLAVDRQHWQNGATSEALIGLRYFIVGWREGVHQTDNQTKDALFRFKADVGGTMYVVANGAKPTYTNAGWTEINSTMFPAPINPDTGVAYPDWESVPSECIVKDDGATRALVWYQNITSHQYPSTLSYCYKLDFNAGDVVTVPTTKMAGDVCILPLVQWDAATAEVAAAADEARLMNLEYEVSMGKYASVSEFSADTYTYNNVMLANGTSSVVVKATALDAQAKVTFAGDNTSVDASYGIYPIVNGSAQAIINVVAFDNVTTKTYTINFKTKKATSEYPNKIYNLYTANEGGVWGSDGAYYSADMRAQYSQAKIGIEENLDATSYKYTDRNTTYSAGDVARFGGSSYIRIPKTNHVNATLITYAGTNEEIRVSHGNNRGYFDDGWVNPVTGDKTWYSFNISSPATVYFGGTAGYDWSNMPEGWTFENSYFYKHFEAGEKVSIPAWGWESAWSVWSEPNDSNETYVYNAVHKWMTDNSATSVTQMPGYNSAATNTTFLPSGRWDPETIVVKWDDMSASVSNNTNVADIKIGGTTIDGFDNAVEEYDITLPGGTTETEIVVETQDTNASVDYYINGNIADDGVITEFPSTVTVVIVSSDETKTREITINVEIEYIDNADATLSKIEYSVDGGEAVALEGFDPADYDYSVLLPVGSLSVSVSAKALSATSTLTPANGKVDVDLSTGTGSAVFTVVSGDTNTTNTYTINFTSPIPAMTVLDENNAATTNTTMTYVLPISGTFLNSNGEAVTNDGAVPPTGEDLLAYKSFEMQTVSALEGIAWSRGGGKETDSEGSTWYYINNPKTGTKAYVGYVPSATSAGTAWGLGSDTDNARVPIAAWAAAYTDNAATIRWNINTEGGVEVPAGEYDVIIKGRNNGVNTSSAKTAYVVVDNRVINHNTDADYSAITTEEFTNAALGADTYVKVTNPALGGGEITFPSRVENQTARDFTYLNLKGTLVVGEEGEDHVIAVVGRDGFYVDKVILYPKDESGLTRGSNINAGAEVYASDIATLEKLDRDNITATFTKGDDTITLMYDKVYKGEAIPSKIIDSNKQYDNILKLPESTDYIEYSWSVDTLPAQNSEISYVETVNTSGYLISGISYAVNGESAVAIEDFDINTTSYTVAVDPTAEITVTATPVAGATVAPVEAFKIPFNADIEQAVKNISIVATRDSETKTYTVKFTPKLKANHIYNLDISNAGQNTIRASEPDKSGWDTSKQIFDAANTTKIYLQNYGPDSMPPVGEWYDNFYLGHTTKGGFDRTGVSDGIQTNVSYVNIDRDNEKFWGSSIFEGQTIIRRARAEQYGNSGKLYTYNTETSAWDSQITAEGYQKYFSDDFSGKNDAPYWYSFYISSPATVYVDSQFMDDSWDTGIADGWTKSTSTTVHNRPVYYKVFNAGMVNIPNAYGDAADNMKIGENTYRHDGGMFYVVWGECQEEGGVTPPPGPGPEPTDRPNTIMDLTLAGTTRYVAQRPADAPTDGSVVNSTQATYSMDIYDAGDNAIDGLPSYYVVGADANTASTVTKDGRYIVEDNIIPGSTSKYADRLDKKFGSETNDYFKGATIIRTLQIGVAQPFEATYQYTNGEWVTTITKGSNYQQYYGGAFSGKNDEPYWLTFKVTSDARVFMTDPHGFNWPNAPADWTKNTKSNVLLSGMYAYWYKDVEAGDIVQIPNYGTVAALETGLAYDPPIFVVVWNSDVVDDPFVEDTPDPEPEPDIIILDEDNGNGVSTDPTSMASVNLSAGNYMFPVKGAVDENNAYTAFDYQTMLYVPEYKYWPEVDSEGSTWFRSDVKGIRTYAGYTPSAAAAEAGKTTWGDPSGGRGLPRAWQASYNLAATWNINGTDAAAKNVTVPAGEYNIIIKGRVPTFQMGYDKSFYVVVDDVAVGSGKARGYSGNLKDIAHTDGTTVKQFDEFAGGDAAYYWDHNTTQTVRDYNYLQICTNLNVTAAGEQHRISIVGREGAYADKIFLVPVGTSGLTTDTLYYEGNELIAPIEAADTDNLTATFKDAAGSTLATITYDKKLAGQPIPTTFDGIEAPALKLPENTATKTYAWSQTTLPATSSTISIVETPVEPEPPVVTATATFLDERNASVKRTTNDFVVPVSGAYAPKAGETVTLSYVDGSGATKGYSGTTAFPGEDVLAYKSIEYQRVSVLTTIGWTQAGGTETDSNGSTWYYINNPKTNSKAYVGYTPSATATSTAWGETTANARAPIAAWAASYTNNAIQWKINGEDGIALPAGEYDVIVKARNDTANSQSGKTAYVFIDDRLVSNSADADYSAVATESFTNADLGSETYTKVTNPKLGGGEVTFPSTPSNQKARDFVYLNLSGTLNVATEGETHRIAIVGRDGFFVDKVILYPKDESGIERGSYIYAGDSEYASAIAAVEELDTNNVMATVTKGEDTITLMYDKVYAGENVPSKFIDAKVDTQIDNILKLPENTSTVEYIWSVDALPDEDSTITMVEAAPLPDYLLSKLSYTIDGAATEIADVSAKVNDRYEVTIPRDAAGKEITVTWTAVDEDVVVSPVKTVTLDKATNISELVFVDATISNATNSKSNRFGIRFNLEAPAVTLNPGLNYNTTIGDSPTWENMVVGTHFWLVNKPIAPTLPLYNDRAHWVGYMAGEEIRNMYLLTMQDARSDGQGFDMYKIPADNGATGGVDESKSPLYSFVAPEDGVIYISTAGDYTYPANGFTKVSNYGSALTADGAGLTDAVASYTRPDGTVVTTNLDNTNGGKIVLMQTLPYNYVPEKTNGANGNEHNYYMVVQQMASGHNNDFRNLILEYEAGKVDYVPTFADTDSLSGQLATNTVVFRKAFKKDDVVEIPRSGKGQDEPLVFVKWATPTTDNSAVVTADGEEVVAAADGTYTVELAAGTESAEIVIDPTHEDATGYKAQTVTEFPATVETTVVAEDGSSKTYTVNISVAKAVHKVEITYTNDRAEALMAEVIAVEDAAVAGDKIGTFESFASAGYTYTDDGATSGVAANIDRNWTLAHISNKLYGMSRISLSVSEVRNAKNTAGWPTGSVVDGKNWKRTIKSSTAQPWFESADGIYFEFTPDADGTLYILSEMDAPNYNAAYTKVGTGDAPAEFAAYDDIKKMPYETVVTSLDYWVSTPQWTSNVGEQFTDDTKTQITTYHSNPIRYGHAWTVDFSANEKVSVPVPGVMTNNPCLYFIEWDDRKVADPTLSSLSYSVDSEGAVALADFEPAVHAYNVVVDDAVTTVSASAVASAGCEVASVDVTEFDAEGIATATIVVKSGEYRQDEYTITFRKASLMRANTVLGLQVNNRMYYDAKNTGADQTQEYIGKSTAVVVTPYAEGTAAGLPSYYVVGADANTASTVTKGTTVMVEENLIPGSTYRYSDSVSKKIADTSDYFAGATVLRHSQVAVSKMKAGTYKYTTFWQQFPYTGKGSNAQHYFSGGFSGENGEPYWMEFMVTSGATVYMTAPYNNGVWTNAPADWTKNSSSEHKINGTYNYYYKHFNAGETVRLPSYGNVSALNEAIAYDPPVYLIVWDSMQSTGPEGGIEDGGKDL